MMLNGIKMATAVLVAVLIIGIFIFAAVPQTNEELEKKYAPILGEYEFDLDDMGFGQVIITFYVENGSLWAQTNVASQPGEVLPVDDKEFTFTIEDDDEGLYDIIFLKNDEGEYDRCHVKNESMGMDVIGDKR